MAYPEEMVLVSITGRVQGVPDGAQCVVTIESPTWLNSSAHNRLVPPPYERISAPSGEVLVDMPPTDHPDWVPQNWKYGVTVQYGNKFLHGAMAVPHGATSVDISDALVFGELPVQGDLYVPLSSVGQPNGVAELDEFGNLQDHTHLISDVQDLQVQLDGKQPAGTYLEPDDISNLVSDDTLNEAINTRLPKVNPTVSDSTFLVERTAGGAARWRATGGAVDWEIVGDVLESAYPNQDFTGAQAYIRRLRGGGGNTLVGLTEFGSTPYAAEQRIDQRAGEGVAYLGAKNGLTNVGICGYKATPGPPTAGTWAVGDMVVARDGTWRCMTAGTPGTWSNLVSSATYQPEDQNMIGWTFNPGDCAFGTTVVPTAGLVHFARVKLLRPVLTNLHFHLTAGGSALVSGQCFAAVYNDANALLGPGAVTASLHGTGTNGWGDGGFKTHPLNTPMGVDPGAWYKVAWWFQGTTGPTFTRASNSGSAIVNAGLTAGTARFGTANTGITTTAPGNLTGNAGGATAWFVGAS